MNFLYILLSLLFFSVLIFVHELGHFIVARLCGVKILEFAIGMGPKLFSVKSKKSGTAYSIRLFPIGGFVSMLGESGMELAQGKGEAPERANEDTPEAFFVSSEEEKEPKQVDPELAKQAYCNQSVWKRLLISLAGPAMNVLLGFVLMFVLVCATGPIYNLGSNRVAAFYVEYAAEEALGGLQKGDHLVAIKPVGAEQATEVRSMAGLRELVAANPDALYKIRLLRSVEGKTEEIDLENVPLTAALLESNFNCSNSEKAGLKENDEIIRINGTPVHTADEVSYEIFNQGYQSLSFVVLRNGERVTVENVLFRTEADQGVTYGIQDFQLWAEDYNFLTILKHTFWRSCSTVKMVFDSLGGLFSGRYGVEAVSGPIGITQAISTAAKTNWFSVLNLVIMISINLGVMNLLPLPALDGGHILIYLIEAVRRKPLKPSVEGIINMVGLALLLGLAILISIKDVISL